MIHPGSCLQGVASFVPITWPSFVVSELPIIIRRLRNIYHLGKWRTSNEKEDWLSKCCTLTPVNYDWILPELELRNFRSLFNSGCFKKCRRFHESAQKSVVLVRTYLFSRQHLDRNYNAYSTRFILLDLKSVHYKNSK